MGKILEPEKYVEHVEDFEKNAAIYKEDVDYLLGLFDSALKRRDADSFLDAYDLLMSERYKKYIAKYADLVRIKYMSEAIKSEKRAGAALFIHDTDSVDDFLDKYNQINLYLRRLEFDIGENDGLCKEKSGNPYQEECFDYFVKRMVSPYSLAMVAYNNTSKIVMHEKVFMKIASYYLDNGDAASACIILCMIKSPSDEAKELIQMIKSMGNA